MTTPTPTLCDSTGLTQRASFNGNHEIAFSKASPHANSRHLSHASTLASSTTAVSTAEQISSSKGFVKSLKASFQMLMGSEQKRQFAPAINEAFQFVKIAIDGVDVKDFCAKNQATLPSDKQIKAACDYYIKNKDALKTAQHITNLKKTGPISLFVENNEGSLLFPVITKRNQAGEIEKELFVAVDLTSGEYSVASKTCALVQKDNEDLTLAHINLLPTSCYDAWEAGNASDTKGGLLPFKKLVNLPSKDGKSISQFIFQKLCNAGNLEQALTAEAITPEERKSIAIDIASALAALEEQGLHHKDVKLPNIFLHRDVKEQLHAYLGDPGSCAFYDSKKAGEQAAINDAKNTRIPTLAINAPEMVLDIQNSPAADRWSLGLIFYDLFSGEQTSIINQAEAAKTDFYGTEDFIGAYEDALQPLLVWDESLGNPPIQMQSMGEFIVKKQLLCWAPEKRAHATQIITWLNQIPLDQLFFGELKK